MIVLFLIFWDISILFFIAVVAIYRRRQWHPTPVLLPGKSHGWRSLVGCSPWGCWESDTTERLHFHFSLSCIGVGNGNPLQCSCLENPRDGGAWWAAVYGVAQSWAWLKRLSSSSSTNLSPGHKRSVFSTFSPVLVLCCLFDSSRLTGERRCLVVVLIAFSFMISDVEHLFMCVLAIWISSWKDVCSHPLPIF